MRHFTKVAVALAVLVAAGTANAKELRVGLGDIETVETLNLLIAFEHARQKGLDIKLTSFKSEDVANQAVVNDQADIGIGVPYTVIQKVKAPIRLFYQLAKLQFYPVVNKEFYKSWKDLNGGDLVVHSRTSGTLAIANLMAQKEGIKFGNISYVPGSEVRALGLLNGTIKATIIDGVNKNFVFSKAPDKFIVLPLGELQASDEALFARTEVLESRSAEIQVLLESLLNVWRKIAENPAWAAEERTRLGLLKDLPKDLEKEIVPYYQTGVEGKMFPLNGGGAEAAKADFEFYTVAGQIQGNVADLKVEDFWYLKPLEAALAKLGRK